MPSISSFKFSILPHPPLSTPRLFSPTSPSIFRKLPPFPHFPSSASISRRTLFRHKSSEEEADIAGAEDEWLQKLPEKKKALYSHSLPCVEAWLRSLGFYQSRDDRAVWFVEKPDWHAQLSLDVTDLYIRLVLLKTAFLYNLFRF
ncbi:tRNA dimethylallyltransferase [Perilla frutescens var. hirtella]|uniref:tRNA dimethylallyltransferase n=1 Tax=Perilla frutescens var. hirtella TaxID=608512 RepID=A0AAD4PDR8_PERFH|nr:tRNA dimethylallyltransferase [Perilla frutescens var. frutescens]KAH6784025.1 tRNA dimethylallyltransferase [Perilla frutescens var. hirtella]KAH6836213.1 tRNA dimethylallyltransferase [Perilla frutescens var. hirtella]